LRRYFLQCRAGDGRAKANFQQKIMRVAKRDNTARQSNHPILLLGHLVAFNFNLVPLIFRLHGKTRQIRIAKSTQPFGFSQQPILIVRAWIIQYLAQ